MLRKTVELFNKCKIKRRAEKIGEKLTQQHNLTSFVSLETSSFEFRFSCRNMIRVNRVINGCPPFERCEQIIGSITETDFVLTSFGNVKKKETK